VKETGAKEAARAVEIESGADAEATDSDVDAVESVIDAAPSGADPVATLLERSPDCLACAEASCSNALEACRGVGTASAGPAAGTPKSALCDETLACFLSNSCSIYAPFACYCDVYATFVEPRYCDVGGPCHDVFERSMESTTAPVVAQAFTDASKAGTLAVTLLQCLRDSRCRPCFPAPPEAGADGDDDAAGE
jgi:hypothetical protein